MNADRFSLVSREITTCMWNIKKQEKQDRAVNNIKRNLSNQQIKVVEGRKESSKNINNFYVF